MARPKIFLCFDYDHDLSLKGDFIHQARHQDSPFSMNDFSLSEPYPDREWVQRAQSNIARCDVFIVLGFTFSSSSYLKPSKAHCQLFCCTIAILGSPPGAGCLH